MIPNSAFTATCKKVYLCPSTPKDSCQWEGDAPDILEHFQHSHKDLLMDSSTIKADVRQDSEQNRLVASEKGLFLVQTKVSVERAKLWIRLRSLASEERVSKMRYSVEVSTGTFGFVNEGLSGAYNPVYNAANGVEVDIQAIKLFGNIRGLDYVTAKINILDEGTNSDEPEEDDVILNGLSDANVASSKESSLISDRGGEGGESDRQNDGDDDNDVDKSSPCEFLHGLKLHDKCALNDTEEFREEDEDSSDVMINCTNCHYSMIPPIYMCPDGHSVCYSCRNHICSICGQKITELRNIDLEEHSKTLEYPCRYGAQGCSEKYKFNEIRIHEIHCEYCIFQCELCPYEARFVDIRTHFRIAHPSTKLYERMTEIPFSRGSSFIIMNNNAVFYCNSCATEAYIEWKVVFCGPKERDFSCEVRITGKKQNQRVKHYFLKRHNNVFRFSVSYEQLKYANVKEKNSMLYISCY